MNLTEEERAIWAATYAATFVAEFRECSDERGVEKAIDNIVRHAEEAETIADLAIEALREVRKG